MSAQTQVLPTCGHFLTGLVDRNHNRDVQARSNILRQRNELLGSLQETLAELPGHSTGLVQHPETCTLNSSRVEALHLLLETLAVTTAGGDADHRARLLKLTQDRSDLMDEIRRQLLGAGANLP